jgi:hypothetical protein
MDYKLKGSCDPWKPLIKLGVLECPLCLTFKNTSAVFCQNCPIKLTVKKIGCNGTPYERCEAVMRSGLFAYTILTAETVIIIKEAIEQEANFLKTIIFASNSEDECKEKTIKTKEPTQDEKDIAEFMSLLKGNFYGSDTYKPYIVLDNNRRIMYIRLPPANTEWAEDIFQAATRFVKQNEHNRYHYYDATIAKAGYVSIKVGVV